MVDIECTWAGRSWTIQMQLIHPFFHEIRSGWITAILDTGATRTHVPPNLLQFAKKQGHDFPAHGISSDVYVGGKDQPPVKSRVWGALLQLAGANNEMILLRPSAFRPDHAGYTGVISVPGVDPVVGVDVLMQGRLAIEGPSRLAVLSLSDTIGSRNRR